MSAGLPANFISPSVPHDVAAGRSASTKDLALFAWREFIALNWPAMNPRTTGVRGRANPKSNFLTIRPEKDGDYPLLVWETYRHKNELFPADGKTDPSFDSKEPHYDYKFGPYKPGDPSAKQTLFNNLDEGTQIGLDMMFAHAGPPNTPPTRDAIRVLYEAKVNRAIFDYANHDGLTNPKDNYSTLTNAKMKTTGGESGKNLLKYGGICSSDPSIISLPCGNLKIKGDAGEGAIEIKAAWRRLTPTEMKSGRFYTRKVIYYTGTMFGTEYYHNAVYGLIALHIIHKTKSFPDFVFATWEQVDDFNDVTNSNDEQLKFVNTTKSIPNIPVIRTHPINSAILQVNAAVHKRFRENDPSSVWQYYKLVGVQATPMAGPPSHTAPLDTQAYYYLANIVVETNQTLQSFYGRAPNGVVEPYKNVYLHGALDSPLQMGGCQGCHGRQGQEGGGDMSVVIAQAPRGSNMPPDTINETAEEAVQAYLARSTGQLNLPGLTTHH